MLSNCVLDYGLKYPPSYVGHEQEGAEAEHNLVRTSLFPVFRTRRRLWASADGSAFCIVSMESESKRRKLSEPTRPVIMDANQAMLRIEELERQLSERQTEINRLKSEVRFPYLIIILGLFLDFDFPDLSCATDWTASLDSVLQKEELGKQVKELSKNSGKKVSFLCLRVVPKILLNEGIRLASLGRVSSLFFASRILLATAALIIVF